MTSSNEPASGVSRRRFLWLLASGATVALPGWKLGAEGLWGRQEFSPTPTQTEGPFYPRPSIEQQMFHDTDLIRKLGEDEVAKGQQISLVGVVRSLRGEPLENAVVEVWQASHDGQYNHPEDAADDPELDHDFQFWGRAITGPEGRYDFSTIIPGEYPGRFARHVHFRVDADGRRLTTQCYFSNFGERNARDGIYSELSARDRRSVTVELDEHRDQPWTGAFEIFM